MGNSIRLGNVTISDVNFNNQFDPGMDLVTNSFGKALTAKTKAHHLGKILKFLQVPRWKGIRLLEASRYLDYFSEARRQAHFGDVRDVAVSLQEAKDEAAGLGISFNRRIANQIIKRSLIKGAWKQIHLAKKLLGNGADPSVILKHLKQAEMFETELQSKFKIRIQRIQRPLSKLLKTTLQKVLPYLILEAKNAASAGDIYSTEAIIQDLHEYASKARQRFQINFPIIPVAIKKIMQTAYLMGIPKLYQKAWNLATHGQTIRTRRVIRQMRTRLNEAQKVYGLTLNYRVNWADLILEEALIKGIDDNLRLALRSAQRKPVGHQRWIRLAEQYVREYNIKFSIGKKLQLDTAILDEIRDCSQKLTPCPSIGSLPLTQRP